MEGSQGQLKECVYCAWSHNPFVHVSEPREADRVSTATVEPAVYCVRTPQNRTLCH